MDLSLLFAVAAGLAAAEANVAEPSDLEAQARQVDTFEAAGRHARAAAIAEDMSEAHPQDYGWSLRAGWLRFQAQHYGRATAHYERAVELSQGSLESRLGLAWSLLYDGHRRRALAEFEALERDFPEAPEVAEAAAFARARSPVAVRPWAGITGQVYTSHPELRRGAGVQGGVGFTIAEHFALAGSYGYARIAYDPIDAAVLTAGSSSGGGGSGGGNGNGGNGGNGGGNGGGGSGSGPGYGRAAVSGQIGSAVEQHQVHLSTGPIWPVAGALLQYGFLRDEGLEDMHAVGLSVRWSPWGDIALSSSATITPGRVRPRLEPSWRLPVHDHVWVRPGVAVQVDGDEALAAGALTAAVHGKLGAVWLGGKYGRERQPAYLDIPVIFNIPGDIRWGAWVGGQLQLPAGLGLTAGYELHGVEAPTLTTPVESIAHYITLGVSFLYQ